MWLPNALCWILLLNRIYYVCLSQTRLQVSDGEQHEIGYFRQVQCYWNEQKEADRLQDLKTYTFYKTLVAVP